MRTVTDYKKELINFCFIALRSSVIHSEWDTCAACIERSRDELAEAYTENQILIKKITELMDGTIIYIILSLMVKSGA